MFTCLRTQTCSWPLKSVRNVCSRPHTSVRNVRSGPYTSVRKVCSGALTSRKRQLSSSAPRSSVIEQLQAAFRDKSSPFYLEPGTQGPSSPGDGYVNPDQTYPLQGVLHKLHGDAAAVEQSSSEESSNTLSPAELGRKKFIEDGFDPESFYEQKVIWGDLDSFRHVNNVRYIRYLESARIHWMLSLGHELGGEQKARDMIAGKGISLILAEISIKFRRPVLFPDTLLIAHRLHDLQSTRFGCQGHIWSYSQKAVVATSDSKLVWYDYDRLKKCDPGPEMHALLAGRIRT